MSADYNLYVKKDYPKPDKCIFGININNCLSKSIVHLIFNEIPIFTQDRNYIEDRITFNGD